MWNKLLISIGSFALIWICGTIIAQTSQSNDHLDEQTMIVADDGHDHDHGNESDEDTTDQHDQPAEDTHAETDSNHNHEEDSGGLEVELTAEAVKLAGIIVATAKHGLIDKTIELPGEIGFNEDRVAHISPRFAGIAKQAKFRVGEYVQEGEIVAIVESNESMNTYSIKAPISGWIIDRHITSGEFVSEENSIFVIADLSNVWVNLAVYPKDAERVRKGQVAEIKVIGSESITSGTIEYVTPIVDFRTRSLTARITLANPDNKWRPGSFVQGTITTKASQEGLVVEKSAIQILDERSVVFVVDGPNRFRPVEVKTGDSDRRYTQVLSGLNTGTKYVSAGAFELKAKIVTSNLDAHAGHGH